LEHCSFSGHSNVGITLEDSAKKESAFADHAATFAEHLRSLQRDLDDSMHATAQLRHEKVLLEQREARLRLELEESRELADGRYNEIQRVRQDAEEARARSERMIAELDRRNDDLRTQIDVYQRELSNLRSRYDDRQQDISSDSNHSEQQGLSVWGARTLAGRMDRDRSERRDR
jgi:chromosome segregation ATPase